MRANKLTLTTPQMSPILWPVSAVLILSDPFVLVMERFFILHIDAKKYDLRYTNSWN